jgi:aspartyl-tRNA(Asn)/glutamyl-tRNA(Gln) amidotransferase subunit B
VQRAIEVEIARQVAELDAGKEIISETRTFNQSDGKTYSMRTKEELNDYRYFPDPDLSPITVSDEWLNEIRSSMPELPGVKQSRFVRQYAIPEYDAAVLTESRELAEYFEEVCRHTTSYKAASNWVMGPVKSFLNDLGVEVARFSVRPQVLAGLISLIDAGKVSYTAAAQKIFPELTKTDRDPMQIAQELNVIQESSTDSILPIVKEVLREFPLKVEEYHNGKKGIVAMFMGEVMKRSRGKADPKVANELLVQNLNKLK